MRVLVVEDDVRMAALVVEWLRHESYAVDHARNGVEGDEMMAVNDYDLAVLDWTIPPPTGLELLRKWRGEGLKLPILMLTGHDTVKDRVDGLDTGADDYLTKPFDFSELLARVRSLLRRREKALQMTLTAGNLEMDRVQAKVTVAGKTIELSPKEFALLEYFLRHQDEVVSRSDIEEHVWDSAFDSMANVVDVNVHRLRKKIDGDAEKRLLHTIRGAGYTLRRERT